MEEKRRMSKYRTMLESSEQPRFLLKAVKGEPRDSYRKMDRECCVLAGTQRMAT